MSIDLGADPLTAGLSSRPAPAVDEVIALAAGLAGRPGVRAITLDGTGVSQPRLQRVLGTGRCDRGRDRLPRLLTAAGVQVRDALSQMSFRLVADDDQFMSIAKFRAVRELWGRVAETLGHPDSGAARVHAVTSLPMMTQRDPWVNMLRTTVAAFGAGIGGADTVQVLPFDVAIPGGFPGMSVEFARRIARNTQLLLLEESHLGRVLDAAGGSWYVEDVTETLAAQAWSHFRDIESHGGFRNALDRIAEQIDGVRARRFDDIAHRRASVTGVNEFPNLAEPPIPQPPAGGRGRAVRSAFEALRDRSDAHLERVGARPRVLLLPLGPLAENNVRATFAANLLASGGIEAINPGSVDADGVGAAVRDAAATVAVICGSDARYGSEARRDRRRGPLRGYRSGSAWPVRRKPSRISHPNIVRTAISMLKAMRWKRFRYCSADWGHDRDAFGCDGRPRPAPARTNRSPASPTFPGRGPPTCHPQTPRQPRDASRRRRRLTAIRPISSTG